MSEIRAFILKGEIPAVSGALMSVFFLFAEKGIRHSE